VKKKAECNIGSSRRHRFPQAKLVEDTKSGALIVFLDELDDSQLKASSHRKRAAESVSEVLEEKIPRVEQGIAR
jgi:hypothetical protein